ncbi:major facilitator superfamily domain-containing protein [Aspergillus germanicus]
MSTTQVHHKYAKEDIVESFNIERVPITEEESKRIRRKIDRNILVVLIWLYFLQKFDKTVLGYAATFGLREDTGLTGYQYSLVSSIEPIAQLVWQPFSSFLIVKVPHRTLMPLLCLGWGISQACMAACHSFGGLMATRFFLGLFEAGCLPLFSVMTSHWYRRGEQPLRVAAWYSMNGVATMAAAAISYGLGHIESDIMKPWQIIFLFAGLLTIVSAPLAYWRVDNDIMSARFLTETEKAQALERVYANQTGTGSREFKMSHAWEALLEPKTWGWVAIAMLINVGAIVTTTFGPLLINGLGFDKYTSSLLNMPFGALQVIVILVASYLAQVARLKGAMIDCFVLPVIAGLVLLFVLPRDDSSQAALLAGYYLLAFLYGGNPLTVVWIVGNTAGSTKQSVTMSLYNGATSAGNVIGPLLMNKKDAPGYHPGLRVCLGLFCALFVIVLLQWANLVWLNHLQARRRVENGKEARIVDKSMKSHMEPQEQDGKILGDDGKVDGQTGQADAALLDLTDKQNDEFVYIY